MQKNKVFSKTSRLFPLKKQLKIYKTNNFVFYIFSRNFSLCGEVLPLFQRHSRSLLTQWTSLATAPPHIFHSQTGNSRSKIPGWFKIKESIFIQTWSITVQASIGMELRCSPIPLKMESTLIWACQLPRKRSMLMPRPWWPTSSRELAGSGPTTFSGHG